MDDARPSSAVLVAQPGPARHSSATTGDFVLVPPSDSSTVSSPRHLNLYDPATTTGSATASSSSTPSNSAPTSKHIHSTTAAYNIARDVATSKSLPHQADTEQNCERTRPEEQDHQRRLTMSSELMSRTVTPFLKDHIPGLYSPLAKKDTIASMQRQNRDPNSRYCYRHRPDSKCRRAADEVKMAKIQTELENLKPDDQQAITHVWSLFSAAPAKHRELMLQGIMTQCCFPQLSKVSREVADQLKIDFITALPPEDKSTLHLDSGAVLEANILLLGYKILCYLDPMSLCRAALVSKQWRELADDDQVWYRMCEQHIDRKCTKCGFGLPLLERKRLRDWTRMQQLSKDRLERATKPRVPIQAPTLPAPNSLRAPSPMKREASEGHDDHVHAKRHCGPTNAVESQEDRKPRAWKDVYRDRFRVGYNWRNGYCDVKVFRGHDNGVTCLQIDDVMMATGSYDATIRIWNLETGKQTRVLHGHRQGIRSLQFDDKILVSGSLDGTIKIWNWHTGELLNTLVCHQGGVISVHLDGEWLASGSTDKTIKVFNLKTKESFTLKGHSDWVNQVRIDGTSSRTLFSASDDCKVKLWDLDSKQCIRTFEGHVGHVQQVLTLPADFEPDEDPASEQNNDATDVASVTSGRGNSPSHSQQLANSLAAKSDDYVRAAYGPGFMDDPERSLPSRYILSSALDSTIKCWDTATGQCVRTFFGHLEGVWALVGDTLRVVSGANDTMIKVWEPRSGKCERTWTGHRGPVTCVGLSDSRMASGSEDGEVRLYSFHDRAGLEVRGTPS